MIVVNGVGGQGKVLGMLEIPLTIRSRVEKVVIRVCTPAKFDLLLGNDIISKFQMSLLLEERIVCYQHE